MRSDICAHVERFRRGHLERVFGVGFVRVKDAKEGERHNHWGSAQWGVEPIIMAGRALPPRYEYIDHTQT